MCEWQFIYGTLNSNYKLSLSKTRPFPQRHFHHRIWIWKTYGSSPSFETVLQYWSCAVFPAYINSFHLFIISGVLFLKVHKCQYLKKQRQRQVKLNRYHSVCVHVADSDRKRSCKAFFFSAFSSQLSTSCFIILL